MFISSVLLSLVFLASCASGPPISIKDERFVNSYQMVKVINEVNKENIPESFGATRIKKATLIKHSPTTKPITLDITTRVMYQNGNERNVYAWPSKIIFPYNPKKDALKFSTITRNIHPDVGEKVLDTSAVKRAVNKFKDELKDSNAKDITLTFNFYHDKAQRNYKFKVDGSVNISGMSTHNAVNFLRSYQIRLDEVLSVIQREALDLM